jgi:hypothetical protein
MLLDPTDPIDCLIMKKVPGWRSRDNRDSLYNELRSILESEIQDVLRSSGQTHPPIDPLSIHRVGKAELDFRLSEYVSPEGQIIPTKQGFSIDVKCRDRSELGVRERFTLAHEIAHLFFYDTENLPPQAIFRSRPPKWGWKEEGFCHEIARRILVPSFTLDEVLTRNEGFLRKPSPQALRQLCSSRCYQASIAVVGMRMIKDTAIWKAILVKSKIQDRTGKSFEVKSPFPIKPKRALSFKEFQVFRVPRVVKEGSLLFPHLTKAFNIGSNGVLSEKMCILKGKLKFKYVLESSLSKEPFRFCTTVVTNAENLDTATKLV